MRDLEDSSPLSPTAGSKRWRLTRLLSGGRWPQATRFIVVLLILYAVKQIFSVAAYYRLVGTTSSRISATCGRWPAKDGSRSCRTSQRGARVERWRSAADRRNPRRALSVLPLHLGLVLRPGQPALGRDPPRIVTVPGLGYFLRVTAANHPPLYYATMVPLYAASSGASPAAQHISAAAGGHTVRPADRLCRVPCDASALPGTHLTVTVPALVAFQPQVSTRRRWSTTISSPLP